MISNNLLKLAKEWFEKGNHDLKTAQILDKEKGPVDNLNRFYIDSRYPTNMPFEYSQNEVTDAIGQVEEMIKFVKKSTQT